MDDITSGDVVHQIQTINSMKPLNSCELSKLSEDEKYEHIAKLKYYWDYESAKSTAIKEGQQQAQRKIIRRCLQKGLDIELTAKITGTAISEIEDIKKSMNL